MNQVKTKKNILRVYEAKSGIIRHDEWIYIDQTSKSDPNFIAPFCIVFFSSFIILIFFLFYCSCIPILSLFGEATIHKGTRNAIRRSFFFFLYLYPWLPTDYSHLLPTRIYVSKIWVSNITFWIILKH